MYALPPNVHGKYMILNCADCELATVYPTPGPDIIDAMYSEAPPENSVGREVFSSKILNQFKEASHHRTSTSKTQWLHDNTSSYTSRYRLRLWLDCIGRPKNWV